MSHASNYTAWNKHLPANLQKTSNLSLWKSLGWIQLLKIGYHSSILHPERLTHLYAPVQKEGSDNFQWLKLKMKYEQNPQKRTRSVQLTLFKLAHVNFSPGHSKRSIRNFLISSGCSFQAVNIRLHLPFELLELFINNALQVSPVVMFK